MPIVPNIISLNIVFGFLMEFIDNIKKIKISIEPKTIPFLDIVSIIIYAAKRILIYW